MGDAPGPCLIEVDLDRVRIEQPTEGVEVERALEDLDVADLLRTAIKLPDFGVGDEVEVDARQTLRGLDGARYVARLMEFRP